MSDFSFLAVPNIEGMRFLWYLKMIVIVLLFGVCVFFVLYFGYISRRNKKLIRQLASFDQRGKVMEQQLMLQKIFKSSDKELVVLFIDYLERFVTNNHYANVDELLLSCGFSESEAEDIQKVLYMDAPLSTSLEVKIHRYLAHMKG